MSRTIKAIECHMIPQVKVPPVRLGLQSPAANSSPNGSNADQKHFPDTHFLGANPVRDSWSLVRLP
jgi:hypothetical protein